MENHNQIFTNNYNLFIIWYRFLGISNNDKRLFIDSFYLRQLKNHSIYISLFSLVYIEIQVTFFFIIFIMLCYQTNKWCFICCYAFVEFYTIIMFFTGLIVKYSESRYCQPCEWLFLYLGVSVHYTGFFMTGDTLRSMLNLFTKWLDLRSYLSFTCLVLILKT